MEEKKQLLYRLSPIKIDEFIVPFFFLLFLEEKLFPLIDVFPPKEIGEGYGIFFRFGFVSILMPSDFRGSMMDHRFPRTLMMMNSSCVLCCAVLRLLRLDRIRLGSLTKLQFDANVSWNYGLSANVFHTSLYHWRKSSFCPV